MTDSDNALIPHRQLRLLSLDTGLARRLGAAFFRELPAAPGVYFFYGDAGQLLYIGQSSNLQARIGSYRHVSPDRHPKRILRLVHRVARIEWRPCASAIEAVELERVLLLEHRPPFNRAGIWEGPPWWLQVTWLAGQLKLQLSRHPPDSSDRSLEQQHGETAGPLPSAYRYVHAAIARCSYRVSQPLARPADYPLGLWNFLVPLSLCWSTGDPGSIGRNIVSFAKGETAPLIERLSSMPVPAGTAEQEFWVEQLEVVTRFAATKRPPPLAMPPARAELPLFPWL